MTEAAAHELPKWLDLLESLLTEFTPNPLQRVIRKTLIFRGFKQRSTIAGLENHFNSYIDSLWVDGTFDEYEHAAAVINLGLTSAMRGDGALDEGRMRDARREILSRIEDELSNDELGNGGRATLWSCKMFLANPMDFDAPFEDIIDETAKCFSECVNAAESASFFPIDRLSGRATRLIGIMPPLGVHPVFTKASDRLDVLVSDQAGSTAIAEIARDRAFVHYKNKQLPQAIVAMHVSRNRWMADESLRGSLLASGCLAQWHSEIGLTRASKYFSLTGTYLAISSNKKEVQYLIPRLLWLALGADFHQGAWHLFLEWCATPPQYQAIFGSDLDQLGDADCVSNAVWTSALLMLAYTVLHMPSLSELLSSRLDSSGYGPDSRDILDEVLGGSVQENKEKVEETIRNSLIDRPFSDGGTQRTLRWSAFGIEWTARCNQDTDAISVADEFMAVLQTLLVSCAVNGLVFHPKEVNLQIAIGDNYSVEPCVGDKEESFIVTLGSGHSESPEEAAESTMSQIAVAWSIISTVSVMPDSQIFDSMKESAKSGIGSAFAVAIRLQDICEDLYSRHPEATLDRNTVNPVGDEDREVGSMIDQPLESSSAWLPKPNWEEVESRIKSRYTNTAKGLAPILDSLRARSDVVETVEKISKTGVPDWMIYQAILNSVGQGGPARSDEEARVNMERLKSILDGTVSLTEKDLSIWKCELSDLNNHINMASRFLCTDLGLAIRSIEVSGKIWKFLVSNYDPDRFDMDHEKLF